MSTNGFFVLSSECWRKKLYFLINFMNFVSGIIMGYVVIKISSSSKFANSRWNRQLVKEVLSRVRLSNLSLFTNLTFTQVGTFLPLFCWCKSPSIWCKYAFLKKVRPSIFGSSLMSEKISFATKCWLSRIGVQFSTNHEISFITTQASFVDTVVDKIAIFPLTRFQEKINPNPYLLLSWLAGPKTSISCTLLKSVHISPSPSKSGNSRLFLPYSLSKR